MASAPGSLEVARAGNTIYVRVKGLGIASIGLDLWDFAEEILKTPPAAFIIDLIRCQSFDSTFMGVLVAVAEHASRHEGGGVMVIHPSQHHVHLLDEVGLTKLISVRNEPTKVPDGLEMTLIKDLPRTSEKRIEMIRDAHKRLCDLDERNVSRFGAFLDMLAREMSAKKPKI